MTDSGGASTSGLQPERTALAWQRTVLAMGAGGMLLGRSLFEALPWLGGVTVIGSVAFIVATLAALHRRHQSRSLTIAPGGSLLLAVALAASGGGLLGLVLLLTG